MDWTATPQKLYSQDIPSPPSEQYFNISGQPGNHLYLYSNNSADPLPEKSKLSPYHKKQAHIIYVNAEKFISDVGLNRVGFLTLTFADNVTDYHEATRRWGNLKRRFIGENFGSWCLVKEEQKRGAWHFHILIDCLADIRSGLDFESYLKSQNLRDHFYSKYGKGWWKDHKEEVLHYERKYIESAPAPLRRIWAAMKEPLRHHGFGISSIMPIQSTIEAAARYVGKYCSKHVENRSESSKHVRLSAYSKDFLKSSTKFQWHNPNSKLWRHNVAILADHLGCKDIEDISKKLGAKWAYNFQDIVIDIEQYSKEAVLQFFENNTPNYGALKHHPGHHQGEEHLPDYKK